MFALRSHLMCPPGTNEVLTCWLLKQHMWHTHKKTLIWRQTSDSLLSLQASWFSSASGARSQRFASWPPGICDTEGWRSKPHGNTKNQKYDIHGNRSVKDLLPWTSSSLMRTTSIYRNVLLLAQHRMSNTDKNKHRDKHCQDKAL